MQSIIIGGVALLVGTGMAGATAFGVVNSATSPSPSSSSDQDVLVYGSTK